MHDSALAKEWRLQQNQFDSYEKFSLLIKLVSIVIAAMVVLTQQESASVTILIVMLLAILWLQDAIWKTFQSRIEARLLTLESAILAENSSGKTDVIAYQFNQAFINNRIGGLSTMAEYLKQALRPTIAYPHVVVLTLLICSYCIA